MPDHAEWYDSGAFETAEIWSRRQTGMISDHQYFCTPFRTRTGALLTAHRRVPGSVTVTTVLTAICWTDLSFFSHGPQPLQQLSPYPPRVFWPRCHHDTTSTLFIVTRAIGSRASNSNLACRSTRLWRCLKTSSTAPNRGLATEPPILRLQPCHADDMSLLGSEGWTTVSDCHNRKRFVSRGYLDVVLHRHFCFFPCKHAYIENGWLSKGRNVNERRMSMHMCVCSISQHRVKGMTVLLVYTSFFSYSV